MQFKSNFQDRATLTLLSLLEDDDHMTQRGLASRIGIALGLTNSLLKRAVRKGLVKVGQAPAKRFAYYVTPKGFKEKSRLVGEYLTSSLDFFRQARDEYAVVYDDIKGLGCQRVVLFGAGELAEIAKLSASDHDVDLSAVINLGSNQEQFSGLPVINNQEEMQANDFDAVVITTTDTPQESYDFLRQYFSDEIIFVAPLLHISRSQIVEDQK